MKRRKMKRRKMKRRKMTRRIRRRRKMRMRRRMRLRVIAKDLGRLAREMVNTSADDVATMVDDRPIVLPERGQEMW